MKIGEKFFKYKKDALNHYKEILNKYDFGDVLTEIDKYEVIELLKNRPDYNLKFSNGIKKIIINKVPKYKSKAFYVLDNDSNLEAFSYIKCINGEKTPLTTFSNACREIVQNDINKVKFNYFINNSKKGKVKCQETGELCTWKDLVIDHRQPNTFSVIIDRFIELNNIDVNSVEYIEVLDGVYILKDDNLANKFRNYHKEKANLRIVKKKRNSSRAHQARIKQQKKDLKIE